MKLSQEALIEAYIRDPGSLTEQQRKDVRQFIRSDQYAMYLSDFFEIYYDEFNAKPQNNDKLDAFVTAIFNTPSFVKLHPRKPLQIDRESRLPYPTVLSASTTRSKGKFTPLGSVITKDGSVAIRFIMDHECGEGRGFVLSNNKNFLKQPVLSSEVLRKHFMADDEGRFRFRLSESEMSQMVNEDLILRRSIARLDLNAAELKANVSQIIEIEPGCSLSFSLRETAFTITPQSCDRTRLISVQTRTSAKPILKPIGKDPIHIPLADAPDSIRCTVYDSQA
jgi:hypothetical protein